MRVLKFRQYIDNQWHYWGCFDGKFITPVESSSGENPSTSPHCQFIGLKDKNGKEIYEGDLVKTNDGIARIYWHDFRCGFEALWIKLNRATFDPVWWNAEIIGNIHQTPELLKEEL